MDNLIYNNTVGLLINYHNSSPGNKGALRSRPAALREVSKNAFAQYRIAINQLNPETTPVFMFSSVEQHTRASFKEKVNALAKEIYEQLSPS